METSLKTLQQSIQESLLYNDHEKIQQHAHTLIEDFDQDVRLDVYKTGYILRFLEILEQTYSGLKKLVGNVAFEQLMRNYLKNFRSQHFSVLEVGRDVPSFLQQEGLIAEANIALLEWTFQEVLSLADYSYASLTLDEFCRLPPETWLTSQWVLHPSVRCLSLQYNVLSLWQEELLSYQIPAQLEQPISVLVWRKGQESYFLELSEAHIALVQFVQAGATFAELSEGLLAYISESDIVLWLATLLREWWEEGILIGNVANGRD